MAGATIIKAAASAATLFAAMPSAAPQPDEVIIKGAKDPVVASCLVTEGKMDKSLQLTRLKVMVTKSPKWGTIWRADMRFPALKPGDKQIVSRTVCWKDGNFERPLSAYDPSQNIPPLK